MSVFPHGHPDINDSGARSLSKLFPQPIDVDINPLKPSVETRSLDVERLHHLLDIPADLVEDVNQVALLELRAQVFEVVRGEELGTRIRNSS